MAMVRDAGGDRVQILESRTTSAGRSTSTPSSASSTTCGRRSGSSNLNNRSWTHDSELAAAILDDDRDSRAPADPAGLGDGARRFARSLRLDLMREHLDLGPADDVGLLDPDRAAATVRRQAAALDAWHADGCRGARPPGRLRRHSVSHEQERLSARHRWFTVPAYRVFLDPDGRPLGMKLRRTY